MTMDRYAVVVMRKEMTVAEGDPDMGRRIIVRTKDSANVATFNGDHDVWTAREEAELTACLSALQALSIAEESDDE